MSCSWATTSSSAPATDATSPLGRRDRDTSQLVKARLASGDYLLFRGLAGHRVEQVAARPDDVVRRSLVVARDRR